MVGSGKYEGGGGGGMGMEVDEDLPAGLDGDDNDNRGKVLFERRRTREGKSRGGKKMNVLDKDWILKKKQVRSSESLRPRGACLTLAFTSSIDSEEKTTFQMIRDIQVDVENPSSDPGSTRSLRLPRTTFAMYST